nr:hypothetical protein [Parachlamydiaceae bacterium]
KVAADAILDDVVAIATTEERSASAATFQPTEASFQFFHSLAAAQGTFFVEAATLNSGGIF